MTMASEPKKMRVAYLVTHPIQYQAPLLRRLNLEPDLSVTGIFRSDHSVKGYIDAGFGAAVLWDVPLLDGYPHHFLPCVGSMALSGFWRPWSYGLAKELRRGRYDALWIHGYGHAFHLYAMALGRLLGLPVLLRDEAHQRSRVRNLKDRIKAAAIYAYLRAVVTKFLAIGSANRDRYQVMGVRPEAIHLVPYAVDNRFFGVGAMAEKTAPKAALAAALGLTPDQPVILFAAKLQRRKRCSDLIKAFLHEGVWNHPARPALVIAGDGEEMAQCKALVAGAPPAARSAVKFLGFQNQTDLVRLYRAADIFVLTSNAEAWGLTINEAMSAGCAILASDEIGAVPDLVRGGVNGFTCAAGDVVAQARDLRQMLDDPAALRAMGQESLKIMAHWGFEEDVAGLRQALGLAPRPPVSPAR